MDADDGPYPGDPDEAQERIRQAHDAEWSRWELTCHEIEIRQRDKHDRDPRKDGELPGWLGRGILTTSAISRRTSSWLKEQVRRPAVQRAPRGQMQQAREAVSS
jgi:hypothetical protein